MKKSLIAATLMGALALPAAVAHAQEVEDASEATPGAELSVGATVYDPQGGEVGTIEEIAGGNVVVFTGTHRATLPENAFAAGPNGPAIAMTKAELDAAVAKVEASTNAQMTAALVPGAQVRSSEGTVVGTVQKVEGNDIVVDLPDGAAITLTKEHLTADQNGLKLFMTAEQFQSAVNAASGTAATPAADGAEAATEAATDGNAETEAVDTAAEATNAAGAEAADAPAEAADAAGAEAADAVEEPAS